MAPVIASGLNELRVSSKMPRNIVYCCDEDEYGVGIINLYHYQGTEWILTLTKHIDQNNITDKLLRTSIDATEIEIDSLTLFFELEYNKYNSTILTNCWIKHVWKYV